MKKLLTFAFTMLLGAGLTFARIGGDKEPKSDSGKKATKDKIEKEKKNKGKNTVGGPVTTRK
jgi:hypothetical protein